jgi:hypothetical protein
MNDKDLKELFQKIKQTDALEQPSFESMLADNLPQQQPVKAKRIQLHPYGKWAAIAASIALCVSIGLGILQQQDDGVGSFQIAAYSDNSEEVMLPSEALLETGSNISNWQAPSEFTNPNDNSLLTSWESPTEFLLTLD